MNELEWFGYDCLYATSNDTKKYSQKSGEQNSYLKILIKNRNLQHYKQKNNEDVDTSSHKKDIFTVDLLLFNPLNIIMHVFYLQNEKHLLAKLGGMVWRCG